MPPVTPTYKRYGMLILDEPLEIAALFHCGQIRDIDRRRGINNVTRLYRIDPFVEGMIFITLDLDHRGWSVKTTFGNDVTGMPLVYADDIDQIIQGIKSWSGVEIALATYFACHVYQFRSRGTSNRRLKASPKLAPSKSN